MTTSLEKLAELNVVELGNLVRDKNNVKHKNYREPDKDFDTYFEHLFAWYLKRFLESNVLIDYDTAIVIINFGRSNKSPCGDIAQGFIGEAAMFNKASEATLVRLFEVLDYDWAKEQIELRLVVNRFMETKDRDQLDIILSNKRAWGIRSLLDQLSEEELKYVYNVLIEKKPFYKSDRNLLIQEIQKLLKNKKSKLLNT
jgi:hypothetical protein